MFLILQVTSANAVNLGAASRMVFSQQGGSSTFRKPRFQVWIGYDF